MADQRGQVKATPLATVTPRALVRLEGAYYSVPTRWAGLDLVVRTGATNPTGARKRRMRKPPRLEERCLEQIALNLRRT